VEWQLISQSIIRRTFTGGRECFYCSFVSTGRRASFCGVNLLPSGNGHATAFIGNPYQPKNSRDQLKERHVVVAGSGSIGHHLNNILSSGSYLYLYAPIVSWPVVAGRYYLNATLHDLLCMLLFCATSMFIGGRGHAAFILLHCYLYTAAG